LENDDVRPEAQNATAMPRATATAMRMTVAMTGDTALRLFDIINPYRHSWFNKVIYTQVSGLKNSSQ